MALSMERKIIEIPWENEGFQRSWGCMHGAVLDESEPSVALSMERKIIEIPEENEGSQRSLGVVHGAPSQNLSLSSPSVWGGKSLKILRKMKHPGGPGG